jgi:hypothetical protein
MKLMLRALSLASVLIVFVVSEVAFASNVTVTAANPNSAAPGTVNLNVTVSGSGYKRGAAAKFFVTGTTDPGGVTVNTTTFSSSSQVVATINVDANATIASYDVEVQNTDGSSGKGTELFAVNQNSKNTTTSYNVTSTISNGDGTNAFVLQSDNQPGNPAADASYSVNDSGVRPFVMGGSPGSLSEWELDLTFQNVRTVFIDFSKLSPAAPITSTNYIATLWSRCYDANGNYISLITIAPGTAQTNCSMRINFTTASGTTYSLVMAPAAELPSGSPATGRASVACNSDGTDGNCNSWTITPYAGGTNPGAADLVKHATNGKNIATAYGGFTFRVDSSR